MYEIKYNKPLYFNGSKPRLSSFPLIFCKALQVTFALFSKPSFYIFFESIKRG